MRCNTMPLHPPLDLFPRLFFPISTVFNDAQLTWFQITDYNIQTDPLRLKQSCITDLKGLEDLKVPLGNH